MRYGVIGAMESEVQLLTARMQEPIITEKAGLRFYRGQLGASEAVVVRCGVGKVHAAICAQMLIDLFDVDAIINVGVAGGVSPKLQVMDAVIGTTLIQHDFDLSPLGLARGCLGEAYGGDGSFPTAFLADTALSEKMYQAAKEQLNGQHACYKGVIVSGDQFIAGISVKEALYRQFDAMAAEMEGAAMAQTATANGVPFAVLRTISDLADGGAPVSFKTVVTYAADLAAGIVVAMLSLA
ncbi:MAG: 5'-methylthioadenosine/adenosylhomocysteine nucleosidase [Clostridia bacterium]|nr:5'-methylthioadenosine/adenosylhomocysteine nucleosidase [Clostridia bacterium]